MRESADTVGFDSFSNNVVTGHKPSTTSPTNDGTADGEEVAPVLRVPSVEQGLESQLGLGVETVVSESSMIRRQRQDNLSGSGLEAALCLLRLDGSEHAEKVSQHDAVSKLRLGVNAVDLATILGNGGEWDNEVEIPSETLLGVVDVIDQSLHILLASLVEGHNNKLRASRAEARVHGLVVFGDLTGETAGGDNNLCSSTDETLQDIRTDGSSTSTSHQNILSLEGNTVLRSCLQSLDVETSELLAVLPSVLILPLQMQEGDCLNLAGLGVRVASLLDPVNLAVSVLLGNNLAFAHGQRSDNITIKCLDLELR